MAKCQSYDAIFGKNSVTVRICIWNLKCWREVCHPPYFLCDPSSKIHAHNFYHRNKKSIILLFNTITSTFFLQPAMLANVLEIKLEASWSCNQSDTQKSVNTRGFSRHTGISRQTKHSWLSLSEWSAFDDVRGWTLLLQVLFGLLYNQFGFCRPFLAT